MKLEQLLIFLAGFSWLTLTSLQTVLIARKQLIFVGIVAFVISVVWVFIVRQIATQAQEMWLAYSLGTALGAMVGCWLGHKLGGLPVQQRAKSEKEKVETINDFSLLNDQSLSSREEARKEFLLHLYDQLWRSIDRVEGGLWQFVALYGLIVGAIAAAFAEKKIPLGIASSFALIISFWGINVATYAWKWFHRNRFMVISIEREFFWDEDLGRIMPKSYHERRIRLGKEIHVVHGAIFFLTAGVIGYVSYHLAESQFRSIVLIVFIIGTILTLCYIGVCFNEVRSFIAETKLPPLPSWNIKETEGQKS